MRDRMDGPGDGQDSPVVGELLRRYRRLAGLTQGELGERSGYSADYIRKLERGRRRVSVSAVQRLASVLGLEAAERAALLESSARVAGERVLAGRAPEMEAIGSVLGGARTPALLLAGEPGIGKTRLLQEAVTLAERAGWAVVRGGSRRRVQDPYSPLTEALAASLYVLPEAERQAALAHAGRLGLLLPEVGREPASPPLRPDQERRLLVRAVAAYLTAVAGEQGVLLVLDDLHWAGPDALDLLVTLLTAPPLPIPLRLVGAYRDSEVPAGSALGAAVADLARAGAVQVMDLAPLADTEAAALLAQLMPDDALTAAIVRRAGGVPLFLVSYAEHLAGRSGPDAVADLPWTVAQVIRQRVVALPAAARELLGVAALVGPEIPRGLLGRIAGWDEETILDALEGAVEARLLEEVDGDTYRFGHDLVREAVEQDLSAGRRMSLHRRIGAALEDVPGAEGRAAEIAGHFREGGELGRALPWLLRAAERAAAVFAHAAASRHYRDAADLARELGEMRIEGEALGRLGAVLYGVARFGEAVDVLDRAVALYREQGEQERALRAVALIGEASSFGGRPAEGLARVQPAVAWAEDTPSPALADASSALCALYYHLGRWEEAVAAGEAAAAAAAATNNRRALASAEVWRGLSLGMLGHLGAQREAFDRAAEVAAAVDDAWLRGLATYHHGLGALSAGDLAAGEERIRHALQILDRAELTPWTKFVRARLSEVLMAQGRWAEARQEAERAVAESAEAGLQPGAVYPLAALGRIRLLQGAEEGRHQIQEALAMAEHFDYALGISLTREILAWDALRAGRPAEVPAWLEGPEAEPMVGRPGRAVLGAAAHREMGKTGLAAAELREARDQAVASGSSVHLPNILLHSALLSLRQGEGDKAEGDLAEGLALAREIGLPYEEALLREAESRLWTARGETARERERLEEALAIFRRLGAAPDAARVERRRRDMPPS